MIMNENNTDIGNRAIASVLLLYYHLLLAKGFSHAETVFIDPEEFDGFSYLEVSVEEADNSSLEIDEKLLREGAIVYLLCDLNDQISEFDQDYLKQEYTNRIINEYKSGNMTAIPEVSELFTVILNVPEQEMDYKKFSKILNLIYTKYVVGKFKELIK